MSEYDDHTNTVTISRGDGMYVQELLRVNLKSLAAIVIAEDINVSAMAKVLARIESALAAADDDA